MHDCGSLCCYQQPRSRQVQQPIGKITPLQSLYPKSKKVAWGEIAWDCNRTSRHASNIQQACSSWAICFFEAITAAAAAAVGAM